MTMIEWKVYYNKACAENAEKRRELQVQFHRIITKVNKIICFTHTKISTRVIFEPRKNFVDPRDLHDLCQSLTHATHEPMHPHHPRYLKDS